MFPHKNKDDISNETFITWISRTLKEVKKETIINGWNPLVNGIIEKEHVANLSNIADIDETEEDDNDLINELIDEGKGFNEEMLNYEVVNDDEIRIKIDF